MTRLCWCVCSAHIGGRIQFALFCAFSWCAVLSRPWAATRKRSLHSACVTCRGPSRRPGTGALERRTQSDATFSCLLTCAISPDALSTVTNRCCGEVTRVSQTLLMWSSGRDRPRGFRVRCDGHTASVPPRSSSTRPTDSARRSVESRVCARRHQKTGLQKHTEHVRARVSNVQEHRVAGSTEEWAAYGYDQEN